MGGNLVCILLVFINYRPNKYDCHVTGSRYLFLEYELTSLVAEVISLPHHTRQQFLRSLQYCFDLKSKEIDGDIIEDIAIENSDDMDLEVETTLEEDSLNLVTDSQVFIFIRYFLYYILNLIIKSVFNIIVI